MDISKQLILLEKHLVELINDKHEETSKVIRNDILNFKDEMITRIDRLETGITNIENQGVAN